MNNYLNSSDQHQIQQQQQQQQTRSRSGTLSSIFSKDQLTPKNSNTSTNYSNNNSNHHYNNHSNNINIPSSSSSNSPIHLIDSNNYLNNNSNINNNNNDNLLNLPNKEINLSSSSPINSNFNDFNSITNNNNNTSISTSSPNKRVRSGSLFSTNSIWNDDSHSLSNSNHSLNSDSNCLSNNTGNNNNSNHFLSPSTDSTSFPQQSQSSRNRSYTTNAAIPSVTINSSNDPFNGNLLKNFSSKVSTSPFVSVSNKTNDMNLLLDNFMLSNNTTGQQQQQQSQQQQQAAPRIRSQTYSGSTPPAVHEQLFGSGAPLSSTSSSFKQFYQPQNPFPQQFPPVFEASIDEINNNHPTLIDDFDFGQLIITTNFENTNLGPTKFLLFDNLPLFIDSIKLFSILNNSNSQNKFGTVISVKITITTTSKLALIECSNIETAMNLKANFNHLEIVPGNTLYVAFAKVEQPNFQSQNQPQQQTPQSQPLQQPQQQSKPDYSKHSQSHSDGSIDFEHTTTKTNISAVQVNLMESITKLSSTVQADLKKIQSMINKCLTYPNDQYQDNFGPLPDPIPLRQFDSPTLRELRKVLENKESGLIDQNNELSNIDLEELALAMLDELPEICHDYLGNTIVQKLFTLIKDPLIKLMMVKEITPYLTQLGIHKNGTWAIQKVISLCLSDYQQMYLIGASLKPYSVKLFNDQFGNYVIQGCIKFGSPYNDFVFEAMIDNFLEISFGRFGARCIRTILESYHDPTNPTKTLVTNEQVLVIAGLIVEYANELVVNTNGSLLITWYLDTFVDCDHKIELLMNKFLPCIKHLCVHKLANLTILKLLNVRIDQTSRQTIIDTIFGNTENLEFILQESDNNTLNSGPLFIYKILSYPILTDLAAPYLPTIKRLLMEINIINYHNYKKLMDEVGLSSSRLNRNVSMKRNGRRNNNNNNHNNNNNNNNVRSGNYYNNNNNNGSNHNHNNNPNNNNQYIQNQNQQHTGSYNQPYSQQQTNQQPYIPLQQSQQYIIQPSMYMKQYYAQQAMAQQSMSQQNQHQPPQFSPSYFQQQQQQPQQQPLSPQDLAVMQQLEQLSLSSAALGYNSNPGTPTIQRNSYL
ncbi:hypothetical protein KGF54_000763 [Candida jiufengensis]|uniref:uncharacterized protein n=1 Tax=Candida jiufengensis TaxID=497108 RepID=UPI002224C04E|nr:uncharacterized protein KGF54_000763 [Candida jiufengensis]KAI5956288.1 hypothetical protein KGF54_000763 [Candida jiufengensis]